MTIERIVEIAAPREKVWTVMTDVERWPEWTASVTSVELLDGTPLVVGSRARIRQPRLPVVVWTAIEAGRHFEWRNVGPGLTSIASHRVEAVGAEAARVVLSFGWSGWLAPLIRLVYGDLSRRYVETEAEGLKRRCEASVR